MAINTGEVPALPCALHRPATQPRSYTSMACRFSSQELPQHIKPTTIALTTASTSARGASVELETALRAPVPHLLPAWAGGCAPLPWAHAGAYPLGWAAGSSAQLHDRQSGMHAWSVASFPRHSKPLACTRGHGHGRSAGCMGVTNVHSGHKGGTGTDKGGACLTRLVASYLLLLCCSCWALPSCGFG